MAPVRSYTNWSKFQEIAKEAGAIYKINQMVLVNTEILDSYLEQFKVEE